MSTAESKTNRCFCSTQHTATARDAVGDAEYVTSAPRFNVRCLKDNDELKGRWDKTCFLNAPSFGVKINAAVYKCYQLLEAHARTIGVTLPKYVWNSMAHSKIPQIAVFSDALRAEGKVAFAEEVEAFAAKMSAVKKEDISTMEDLERVLNTAGARVDYANYLHYDHMHELFPNGEKEVVTKLRAQECQYMSSDGTTTRTDTLENRGLRWLSNAFKLFDLEGSHADFVNLVFALLGLSSEGATETDVLSALEKMHRRIETRDFSGLKIFDHQVSDAEKDDDAAWVLISFIAEALGNEARLTVLLPPNGEYKCGRKTLALDFTSIKTAATGRGATVIIDLDSQNANALQRQNPEVIVQ